MSRTYVLGGLVALAILCIAVWELYSSGMRLPWQKAESISVLEHRVTETGDRRHATSTDFYDIEATYPNGVPLEGEMAASAMFRMETWVKDTVEGFIKDGDFENLTEEDKEIIGFNVDRKYALDISFKRFESPYTVSYVYTVYTDTLGAHPNGYFYTFLFDVRTGAVVTLGDILQGDWLTYVSAQAKEQITAHIAEMMGGEGEVTLFEEGLAPREGNFLSAYLDGNDIVILFDPYQVAAYAAGPQEVRIKRTDMGEMLKTEYR